MPLNIPEDPSTRVYNRLLGTLPKTIQTIVSGS